jgi:phage protein D
LEDSKEFLSSDTDSQKSENGSFRLNFPDKVQMEKKNCHYKSNSFIPKLDFTKVKEKYNNETMKKISVIKNNKIVKPINKKEKEEILEAENKNFNNLNEKLRNKLNKYKKGYNDLKELYKGLKVQFKLCCNKIEFLDMQIKRMTNRQSTEDITNKRFELVENTSMVYSLFYFNFSLIYSLI